MKRINVLAASLIPLFSLTGCIVGSDAQYPRNYTPVSESFSVPEVRSVTTRSIGENMLNQGVRTRGEAIQVTNEASFGGYSIQPGTYLKVGSDAQYEYFSQSQDHSGLITAGMMGLQDFSAAVRVDRNGNTCLVGFTYGTKCDSISYQRTEYDIQSPKNFQQTLVYSGRSGDVANLTYREFSGGLIRDAFSNRVEYDLSESDILGYQGARIRVLEADNSSITYEVLEHFN